MRPMALPLFIVDAFTDKPFSGNPAAVCILPSTVPVGPQPRIIVVGHKAHFAQIYPAVLASLGDAADQIGMVPAVSCVAHQDIADGGWTSVLKEADGLVLPGGTDMSQVEGQIAAATAALEQDLPTLGLCLGIQTMTTPFLRRTSTLPRAHPDDTAP